MNKIWNKHASSIDFKEIIFLTKFPQLIEKYRKSKVKSGKFYIYRDFLLGYLIKYCYTFLDMIIWY